MHSNRTHEKKRAATTNLTNKMVIYLTQTSHRVQPFRLPFSLAYSLTPTCGSQTIRMSINQLSNRHETMHWAEYEMTTATTVHRNRRPASPMHDRPDPCIIYHTRDAHRRTDEKRNFLQTDGKINRKKNVKSLSPRRSLRCAFVRA